MVLNVLEVYKSENIQDDDFELLKCDLKSTIAKQLQNLSCTSIYTI